MLKFITDLCTYGIDNYGSLLVGIFFGYILCVIYHRVIGIKELKDSFKREIRALEQLNRTLMFMVHEKLAEIDPPIKSKGFFDKLKGYFWKS